MKGKLLFVFLFGLISAVFAKSESPSFSAINDESISYGQSFINFSARTNDLAAAISALTLTVKNVNASIRMAAQVKLYNADRSSLLNTIITDSSGQAVFPGLSDGTYNYDVYYTSPFSTPLADNTEFWGSGLVTINGSSQSVIFIRSEPYISIGATFSPFTLKSGQPSSGSFSVKNILSDAVDSYVTIWVDRDKTSSWDYTLNSPANTISSGSTSVFPFSVTPIQTGSYYYYAFVYARVNGSYIVTDQYSWTQAFNVEDSSGNISVVLSDHNNTKASSGNKIIRYDQSFNLLDSLLTDANGQASWTDISGGIYHFEGYNTSLNTLWGDDLYWGSKQATVTSGTTSTLNIIQSEPYIENVVINGTVFGPGSTVHVDVIVNNPDTIAKTCKAMIRIDMDKLPAYDFESGFQGPLTIQPGQKSIFGFDWTIPLNTLPGTFYIASCVQTLYSKGYINSDATNWDYSIKNENSTISQIQWSGYTWNVKSGSGLGPGPNNWLANSSAVWVDGEDNLHLKIRKVGANWYCAEISTKPLLGFGDYSFQVSTNVENLDQNIVLGLFTYETDTRELDIEFSRWNDPSNPVGWYNVQPTNPGSHYSFALNLSDEFSTHKFQWGTSKVLFQSYFGHYQYLPDKERLISEWTYTGSQIPPDGNEKIMLNLWLYKGIPPSDLKEAEVVIKSFTFKKVGDLIVQVQNIDNTSVPAPGSNGIVKLYDSANLLISTQQTDQNGSVTFVGIPVGSGYYYQVFHQPNNPATIYGQEYWGSKTDIQIVEAQTTTTIFKRNQPYNGTVKVYDGSTDVTGQEVELGTTLRIEQQNINPVSIVQNAKGSILLDFDKIEPYNYQLTETDFSPIPASTAVTHSWIITPTEIGLYYLSESVTTLLNNNPLICDSSPWSLVPLFKVKPVNKPPVANAGSDQAVNEGSIVALDGSASTDPDNNFLTYLWTAPAGILLSSTTASKPTFTAPEVSVDTNYTFSLVVNDGTLNSVVDQVVITVKQVNKPPIANAGADQSADEGTLLTLDGSASSDPDNNSLTYLWTVPAGISLSSATASKPTFTAPEIWNDTILNFSLTVNDGYLNSLPSAVKISVKNVIKTSTEGLSQGELKIYPNPTSGIFKVEGMQFGGETILEVYSIDGKLIMHRISNSATCEIDMSKQVSGTYLVVVNKQTIRIVKE